MLEFYRSKSIECIGILIGLTKTIHWYDQPLLDKPIQYIAVDILQYMRKKTISCCQAALSYCTFLLCSMWLEDTFPYSCNINSCSRSWELQTHIQHAPNLVEVIRIAEATKTWWIEACQDLAHASQPSWKSPSAHWKDLHQDKESSWVDCNCRRLDLVSRTAPSFNHVRQEVVNPDSLQLRAR